MEKPGMTLIRIFTLVLNLFSALLTGAGFFTFLEPWTVELIGPDYGGMVAAVAAATVSLTVQGLVHTYWWRGGTEGLLPFNVIAGVSVTAVSWLGGAGGALLFASHVDLLVVQQQEEVASTTVPVRAFANDFADLRADMTSLAAAATKLSEVETRSGGTCQNDTNPDGGCGPRCRLRQSHAAELSEIESVAARLESEARNIAIEMSTAADVEAQRELYAQAARLQANTDQRRIASALQSVAWDLDGPVVDIHPETGRETEFTCEDPTFAARVAALAEAAGERVELPETAPRAQSVDMSDGLECVVSRVGEVVFGTAPCPAGVSDYPLLSAAVLETLIVVFLLVEAMRYRQDGRVPTRPERFQQAAKAKLSERALAECRWLVQACGTYVWTGRRASFIAVPVDGDVDAYAEGTKLARYFAQSRPEYVNLPLVELEPGWVGARSDIFGHATVFNLYRFGADGPRRIREAERDLNAPVVAAQD
jgi:hypothetical protein